MPVFANGGNIFVYSYRSTMPVICMFSDTLPCSACRDHLAHELQGTVYFAGEPTDSLFGGCAAESPIQGRKPLSGCRTRGQEGAETS